jgi:CubicO group peptidase (beta-lactamase class C family)
MKWSKGMQILLALTMCITACKNSRKEIPPSETLTKKTIPTFDSIDWSEEFNFRNIDPALAKSKTESIRQFFNESWATNNTSGGLLISWHGKIIFEDYLGFADYENQIPMTAETPLHIASVSKVLTALAVLKLVQFNKINLNDNISKYLEGFPYPNVKIRDLLNHRSGLPNYLHLSDDKNYWDKGQTMSSEDLLELLIQKKPPSDWEPGKKFSYRNTNFVLLALIIEKVTGESYPIAMKTMVFNPLGMNNTFVMEFDKDSASVSKSYYNNGSVWNFDHLDKTYGDKNIYSTPRDLLKMDIAMYAPGFLPQELKDLAWRGYSYETKGIKNYGFGIRLLEWDNGDKLLYHKGLWHGNRATYVRDFKNEVCIIALGNRLSKSIFESMGLVSLFHDYGFPTIKTKNQEEAMMSAKKAVEETNNKSETNENIPEHEIPMDATSGGGVEE